MSEDDEAAVPESPSGELVRLLSVSLTLADSLGHALAAIHIQTASDIINSGTEQRSDPETG